MLEACHQGLWVSRQIVLFFQINVANSAGPCQNFSKWWFWSCTDHTVKQWSGEMSAKLFTLRTKHKLHKYCELIQSTESVLVALAVFPTTNTMQFCLHSMTITLFKHKRNDRFYTVTVTTNQETAGLSSFRESSICSEPKVENRRARSYYFLTKTTSTVRLKRSRPKGRSVYLPKSLSTQKKGESCANEILCWWVRSWKRSHNSGGRKKHYWAIVDSFTKERWSLACWTGHAELAMLDNSGSFEWLLRIYFRLDTRHKILLIFGWNTKFAAQTTSFS